MRGFHGLRLGAAGHLRGTSQPALTRRPVLARAGTISISICAAVLASCAVAPAPGQPAGYSHLTVSPSAQSYRPQSPAGLPVSVVQLSPDAFLFADTADVFRLTRTTTSYVVTRLGRPAVAAWNPSGLAYRAGEVYVANGRGGDILELRIQGDALTLDRRLTSGTLRTPENVVVELDGSVATADTDGVERFGVAGSHWRVRIAGVHGITESDNFVYASSLANRTISKIDLGGDLVRVAGSLGGSVGHYLWPLGLANDGNGVLVTDALSGRISLLDHDLNLLRYAGGNGPGMDAFNFPSAILPLDTGYLIADTFKDRLVRISRTWTVEEQIALGPLVPAGRQRPLVHVTDGRPSSSGRRPQVYVAGGAGSSPLPGVDVVAALGLRPPLSFDGSFGGLDHFDSRGLVTLVDLWGSENLQTGLTWATKAGSVIVVGSPESSTLEVIEPISGMFTSLDVGFDTWWVPGGGLLYPANLLRDLNEVVRPALATFQRVAQLLAQGAGRQQAVDQAVGHPRNWRAELVSGPAQQFWQSGMTRADASRYLVWALQQAQQPVAEILDVKYLSGS